MFIRVNKLFIRVESIVSINVDKLRSEHREWKEKEQICYGNKTIHYVSILASGGEYLFEHGTPEANAIIAWLEGRAEVLL